MKNICWLVPLGAAIVSAIAGCGGSGADTYSGPVHPVTGTIDYKGKPLAAGWVTFNPDPAKGNKFSGGKVAEGVVENGRYKILTGGRNGAPPGWFKATIFTVRPGMPADEEKRAVKIPNKYATPETTPLAFEVKETGGAYDIVIK